ncbi:MAG: winged helix-turn-helix transcriptional regulator [Proteobacteria bacterium]|nr:winged helix-turn-helix transcriptional regulator [Pseudomonadota bacterium]
MADQLCAQCDRPTALRNRDPACLIRRSPAVRAACHLLNGDRLKITALEVLMCVRCGDTNDQIAARLGLSVSTVKYHLARLSRIASNDQEETRRQSAAAARGPRQH